MPKTPFTTLLSFLPPRLLDLLIPLILLATSLLYLPTTLLRHPFLLLTSPRAFQSIWFSKLWHRLGPQMAISPDQVPYISDLLDRAHGTVLELGPGSGDQMRHYTRAVHEGRISTLFAAEPNTGLHARLRASAQAIGLDATGGNFVILTAGAEPASLIPALHRAGLNSQTQRGTFDTVVCVKSMCCVNQAQLAQICEVVHGLLKPGGEFLFFEHVANDSDWLTMAWAWVLGWVWPVAMGNCHLNGKVDKVVRRVKWDEVKVRNVNEFKGFNIFRYVYGICRKGM